VTSAASWERRDGKEVAPVLSVVLPTRNEMGSVPVLLAELENVLATTSAEVIFVDDSDDATPAVIEAAAAHSAKRVTMIHRPPEERGDGLGGAVVEGLRAAKGEWVCVMDADMQHPPRVMAQMLDQAGRTSADIVVATRFSGDGGVGDFGLARRILSRASRASAHVLFPLRLRSISDPLSGFFLVRREALDVERLRPRGFKILLEILVRTRHLRASEVPFVFGERHADESKASLREGLRYLGQLGRLRTGSLGVRVASFGLVGASGLVVNSALLAALTELGGVHYLLSAVVATQGSTAWNFWLSDRLVFTGRDRRRGWMQRFVLFAAVNNIALALRAPLLLLLTSGFGVHYLVSNAITLVVLFAVRFALADTWIWSGRPHETHRSFDYDIHGILTVQSERALPELERFRVPDRLADPSIRIRIGRVGAAAGDDRDRMSYREWGRLGFGVHIEFEKRIEVVASRLLGRSPHVLYTNVVEPILRWRMVERGYALIHGACFARDRDGVLLTARTDTGKTTTILKLLDRQPHGFLSDDLTLVSPDGCALSYPKPLTISRHTVSSVRKPLLSRGERVALILQSRLHSRSGRRLALLIAKAHLPAATINAIVQILVPPPKYDIARLVPRCEVTREARLAGMIVIQRGGRGAATLAPEDAIDVLMLNCEDAFGFPPYRQIEGFLHSRNGADLRAAERHIAALALAGCPTTLLRSETMDWSDRIPAVIERVPRPADQSEGWSLAPVLNATSRTNGEAQ
jgi:glycosyltransferase involved in cell wall biosynthesis